MYHCKRTASKLPCLWIQDYAVQSSKVTYNDREYSSYARQEQTLGHASQAKALERAPSIPSSNNIDKTINNSLKKSNKATGKLGNY